MKKQLYLYIIGCLLSAYLWTACSGTSSQEKTVEEVPADTLVFDSLALRVGYAPTLDVLPLLVAQQAGLVDSLQLDLQLVPFTGFLDMDSALVQGQIHVALTDICNAIQLNNQNQQMKVVGGTTSIYRLVTQRQLRIRRMADLPERMIAIAPNYADDWMLDQLLTQGSIAVDAVNRPQIHNLQLRAEMVIKEMIDAAILAEPYATQAAVTGNRVLGSSNDLNLDAGCIVIPSKVLQNKKDDLQKLVTTYNQGVNLLNTPTNNYSQLLQDAYKVDRQTTDSLQLPVFKELALPDSKAVNKAMDWLKNRYSEQDWLDFRILNKEYKLDQLFDSQLIHE